MRIGWHVPLPGPISVGGTVYRSKRGGGSGCAFVVAVVAVSGFIVWLYQITHGWIFVLPGILAVLAIIGAVVKNRERSAGTPAETPASIADKSLTHMERTCDSIDLAALPAGDLRASLSSLNVMETAISDNLTGVVQQEAQQRVSRLRERLDAALTATRRP